MILTGWLLLNLRGKDVIFGQRTHEENTATPHVSKQGLDSRF